MNIQQSIVFVSAFASCVALADGLEINVVECPKCDKRMRICADGQSATINLARLQDDAPDAATLEKRIAAMKERAARLLALGQERATGDRAAPLMGWSSWNTFAVNISEELIVDTARAMATNGLKDAGYLYVNIDDGFFYGHGEDGKLRIHQGRFPNGLKPVADAIHALGLRAGIYSDAGADTCGSGYNGDAAGIGAGLYGHDADDCAYYFGECGFDFIKVDYCGGKWLKLDERARYTEIAEAIRAAGGGKVRFNVCRWDYPGTWIADIADSWRTTRDIRANWKVVKGIIKENLYLSAFASPGHYNDMDMLEVGHRVGRTKTDFAKHGDTGLTEEEERTHFGIWCMMSSPLLIGCDARTIPPETMQLITNPYLIAMNQNRGLGVQGAVVARAGDAYVLVKDAFERFGSSRYVALCNLGDTAAEVTLTARDLDLGGTIQAFDLVEKADVGTFAGEVTVCLAPHGAKFYLLDADERLERVRYEAETAFIPDYQELHDPLKAGTGTFKEVAGASGGMVAANCRQLVWREIWSAQGGTYQVEVRTPDGVYTSYATTLQPGLNEIRLSAPDGAPLPDIDYLTIVRTSR